MPFCLFAFHFLHFIFCISSRNVPKEGVVVATAIAIAIAVVLHVADDHQPRLVVARKVQHGVQIGVQPVDGRARRFRQVPHVGDEVVRVGHVVQLRVRRKRDHAITIIIENEERDPNPGVQAVVVPGPHAVGQRQRGHRAPYAPYGGPFVLHERGVNHGGCSGIGFR